MKVKKYTADSMRAALEKMKRDLGTGAVILGSRKISRGGLLDFLGKEMFEVTATTEDNMLTTAPAGRSPGNGGSAAPAGSGSRVSYTVGDNGAVTTPGQASAGSARTESFGTVLSRHSETDVPAGNGSSSCHGTPFPASRNRDASVSGIAITREAILASLHWWMPL